MPGLASPDVPAVYSYLIVVLVGAVVARSNVNERLANYPDHWAFFSAWLLFVAYWAIPALLLWLLDHTGAVQDTSLFAAVLIAFGYRQVFAGTVQGVNAPPPAASLWKPFQAWVDAVADRIAGHQKRYLDLFAEMLRREVVDDADKATRLETLALQRSTGIAQLRVAIAAAGQHPEPAVARSRLFDVLWPDLRTSASGTYGFLLHEAGLVSRARRWWYLERGRAKSVTGATSLLLILLMAGVWYWTSRDPRATTIRDTAQRRYHQWRLLKPSSTERDRWRAREYFARELRAAAAQPLPQVADARAETERAREVVIRARRAQAEAKAEDEKQRVRLELTAAESRQRTATRLEAMARHVDGLIRSLIDELRYPDISSRQLDEILRLLMNHHAPQLDAYSVPELIESLRTSNEVTRLNIHKTLLALQKADYPETPQPDKALLAWEPKKAEGADDIDRFVRLWHGWWRTAQAPPRT